MYVETLLFYYEIEELGKSISALNETYPISVNYIIFTKDECNCLKMHQTLAIANCNARMHAGFHGHSNRQILFNSVISVVEFCACESTGSRLWQKISKTFFSFLLYFS